MTVSDERGTPAFPTHPEGCPLWTGICRGHAAVSGRDEGVEGGEMRVEGRELIGQG